MFELRLHERISAIGQAAWDALLSERDSPFLEWTWLNCLEEAGCVGGDSGWQPCHAALYEVSEESGQSTLIAAAPLYIKTNSEGEFVFDWSWAELAQRLGTAYYPKFVCAVPFTPATGARILFAPHIEVARRAELIRTLAQGLIQLAADFKIHGVHLLFPTVEEAELFCEVGYLQRHGVQYHFHNRGYQCFEDFLADLPSKKRTQIRREKRQPERDGVTIETLPPAGYTDEIVETMFRIYLTTVDKFTWGRRYLNLRFFQLLAERFLPRLSWVVARQGERVIAGAFNIKKGDRLYGRYWGGLIELPFLHFNVCYYHGIEQCIREGLQVFEPGAGGEHKAARGFLPTRTYSAHHLMNARLRGVLAPFLEREREAVRAYVNGEDTDAEPLE